MLENLIINNFASGHEPAMKDDHKSFIMMTCQRTLVRSFGESQIKIPLDGSIFHEQFQGTEAYTFLLEIICGLKSKLVGENEIVGQFKSSYKDYVSTPHKCSSLLRIIEKLLKDSKDIRTNYLLGLSQKTYSSIARKHIVGKFKADSVVVMGSGQLAEDLINQFKKKITVYICARNTERVQELSQEHQIEVIPWGDIEKLRSFPFIANSIGFKGTLFDQGFFTPWAAMHTSKLFIDLGSPSAIKTELDYESGVMKLDDVFKEGAVHEDHKKNQIVIARTEMKKIVSKRDEVFKFNTLKKKNFNYV